MRCDHCNGVEDVRTVRTSSGPTVNLCKTDRMPHRIKACVFTAVLGALIDPECPECSEPAQTDFAGYCSEDCQAEAAERQDQHRYEGI